MSESGAFDLLRTFVHLERGAAASRIPLTRRFWSELAGGTRRYRGQLMGVVRVDGDSDHWEAHPAGDEFLFRLSGAMEVVLDGGARPRRVTLAARNSCCIVPKGTWHTLLMKKPGLLMIVTPGDGTRVRAAAK
jgi:mannose-6-phosphate isomerase-like protein (cupin superfamily)